MRTGISVLQLSPTWHRPFNSTPISKPNNHKKKRVGTKHNTVISIPSLQRFFDWAPAYFCVRNIAWNKIKTLLKMRIFWKTRIIMAMVQSPLSIFLFQNKWFVNSPSPHVPEGPPRLVDLLLGCRPFSHRLPQLILEHLGWGEGRACQLTPNQDLHPSCLCDFRTVISIFFWPFIL